MAKMNGEGNVCDYCGGGHGEHGCSGRYGGRYFLVKCILVVLAMWIVFCGGYQLGLIVGHVNENIDNRGMMRGNGYYYNGMMNGQYGQPTQNY